MSEMEKSFADYFRYYFETIDCWKLINNQLPSLLRPLCNQCEQLRLSKRAQLDEQFLQKFPKVKENLCGKIQVGIEEEMHNILKVEEEMKSRVDGLKTRLNSLEKTYSNYGRQETDFNHMIPSFDELFEHALDTWKCFHLLWMGVKTSIETVDYLSKSSVNKISESILKFEMMEHRLRYIAELTQYLRT